MANYLVVVVLLVASTLFGHNADAWTVLPTDTLASPAPAPNVFGSFRISSPLWSLPVDQTQTPSALLSSVNETSTKPSIVAPSNDEFFIRPAVLVDMSPASRILADAFFRGPGTNWITYQYEKFITYLSLEANFPRTPQERSRHEIYVACDPRNGKVLGVVEIDARGAATDRTSKVYEASGRSAYMCNLAVDTKHRRKGIATSLVDECERKVRDWYEEDARNIFDPNYDLIYDSKNEIINDICSNNNNKDDDVDSMKDKKKMSNSLCLKARESDEAAVQMYLKLGYSTVSEEKDTKTNGGTIFLMRKDLIPN